MCWIGYDAIYFVLSVAIADISSLNNRGWIFAASTLPQIINTFVGPIAAQKLSKHDTWRWSYGGFAIVLPLIALPLSAALFKYRPRPRTPKGDSRKTRVWPQARRFLVESDGL